VGEGWTGRRTGEALVAAGSVCSGKKAKEDDDEGEGTPAQTLAPLVGGGVVLLKRRTRTR